MVSATPLLSRKAQVVKAAWQLENAILGKRVEKYPKDIQAARLLHYDCMRFNKWYYRALLALVLLTLFEVPAWCHGTNSKDIWSWHPGSDRCVIEEGDPFLSGIWYVPPGYALIVEICIEIVVLRKFLLDYELEVTHFTPQGEKFQNTSIIFWGWFLAVGSIIDTALFTVFRVPIRLTFLFRTGLLFILPGVQSLFSSIFNLKMFTEFMSISVFLWGTMLFFAWISVTIFGSWHTVVYKEDGENVYVNKDLDSLSSAFYSMFVAAVTGEYVDVFLPTITASRSAGLLWFMFLILAKVLFESLTLDTLVSAYIRGAKQSKEQSLEIRAEGTLAAFETLCSIDAEGGHAIPKELFLEFVNVFSRSPTMHRVPMECADAVFAEMGSVTKENFSKVCSLLDSDMMVAPTEPPGGRSSFAEMLKHYVTEPKDTPAFDKLMNNVLMVNLVMVIIESYYDLNNWEPPVFTGYVELVFSFIYLGEVAVKVTVRSWDVYWLSGANRFDFFTTILLLFTSLLPYLPNSVMPFDLQHYANILRLLRLLRVLKQLKSMRSVQFLASAVTKMVWAAGNILLMLGCVVFFFTTLGVNLFGGVLYKGNPHLEHTEYEEKHWFVFNFNDTPMAFALFFTQLLCEYVPVNAEALEKTSRWGSVAWLIFPLFYFIGVAIMFEILLAFTVEAYIELREENENEEEEEEEEAAEQDGHGHGHEEHGHGGGHEDHAHGADAHAAHGEDGHGHEHKAKFDIDQFFEEVQDKFEEQDQVVHYYTQDEPNFPKLLQEAFEEVMEKSRRGRGKPHPPATHLEIAKAAWQTENAMCHTEWAKYPEDCAAARRDHFKLLQANKLYYKAVVALVILTFCEVPPWCHLRSPGQDMWRWVSPEEWCHVPNGGNPYLSNIWYVPPGWGLLIEIIIELIILRKFLLNWSLERKHFAPIGVQYHDRRVIIAGLFFAVGSILDTLVFTFFRVPLRFTWIFRTGLLFILPGVQRVYTLIFNRRMIGEFSSVAVFFVGTVMFFAWVAVTIFKDLDTPAYKNEEEVITANKGLATLSKATYTLFVSGIGEGFVDNLLPSFVVYRSSGVFWLLFLVIGQILLLNLVIDAFVAAYLKGSEELQDRKAELQAQSIHDAFKTLSVGAPTHVEEDVFLEFVEDLGRSPRMYPIERKTAKILIDQFGEVTEEKFLDACRVIQNPVWAAPKDSFLRSWAPVFWEEPWFKWIRQQVWEPRELPAFDKFMNQVLLLNLLQVVVQSAYNLNNMPQPALLDVLDLIFAFAYVGEVLVKLSVKSWAEYCSFWGNKFDFMTTWLLLFTTLLPYLPFATVQADLKHYANILRLFRLVRVVKQLKQFPRVQFMVATISRMVNAAGDILQLLGVLLFFFSTLSMNLWGGVLYEGHPGLEETLYAKKHLYIFNFNDFGMAFITFFSQLLSEYVPENATALQVASKWGNIAWYVFPAFYLLGVAIIFEITKAFTIEYYLAIKEEAEDDDEEGEEEASGSEVRQLLAGSVEGYGEGSE
ncbi:unnamed protein product [Effrenium voratum]|nr:unnamed protein product [Effrenium voratum]